MEALRSLKRAYLQRKLGRPVIVVSGLPRSGTSMMMKMLQAGGVPLFVDDVRKADEDNPVGYYELENVKSLLKEEDKAWLGEGRGKAIKIVSTLLPGLPKGLFYKVIFMHRHLDEVILSQNKMLRRRGERVDESDDERLHGMLEKHLVRTKLWIDGQSNVAVMDVRYGEVIADPRGQATRVRHFLGGDLDVENMASAVDRSLYHNRH
jgi:Sulfotransferase domain